MHQKYICPSFLFAFTCWIFKTTTLPLGILTRLFIVSITRKTTRCQKQFKMGFSFQIYRRRYPTHTSSNFKLKICDMETTTTTADDAWVFFSPSFSFHIVHIRKQDREDKETHMKWALTMGGDINEAVDDGKTTAGAWRRIFSFVSTTRPGSMTGFFFWLFSSSFPSARHTHTQTHGCRGGCRVHRQYAALSRQTTNNNTMPTKLMYNLIRNSYVCTGESAVKIPKSISRWEKEKKSQKS